VRHFYPPGSESGSTDLIESGSNPDPDPKIWLIINKLSYGIPTSLSSLCVGGSNSGGGQGTKQLNPLTSEGFREKKC
jgi:hypothetical protein